MATQLAYNPASAGTPPEPLTIDAAAVGNTRSDIGDRGSLIDGGALELITTVGSTPTVTVNIQGSFDGTNWFNVPYALVATPRTFVITAITITTATTNRYLLQEGIPYRYLSIVRSANTNVTFTTTKVWLR